VAFVCSRPDITGRNIIFETWNPISLRKLWREVLAPEASFRSRRHSPPDGDGLFLAGLKPAGQRQANRKRLDRMKVPVGNAIDHFARQPRDVKIFDLATTTSRWRPCTCISTTTAAWERGLPAEVRHFADHIIAERGVRYGRVVVIPTAGGKKTPSKRTHRQP
jgi:hypothetical protein